MPDAPITIRFHFNSETGLMWPEDLNVRLLAEIFDLKLLAIAVSKFTDRIEMTELQLIINSRNNHYTLNIVCRNPEEYSSIAVKNLITAEILYNLPTLEDLITRNKAIFKINFMDAKDIK